MIELKPFDQGTWQSFSGALDPGPENGPPLYGYVEIPDWPEMDGGQHVTTQTVIVDGFGISIFGSNGGLHLLLFSEDDVEKDTDEDKQRRAEGYAFGKQVATMLSEPLSFRVLMMATRFKPCNLPFENHGDLIAFGQILADIEPDKFATELAVAEGCREQLEIQQRLTAQRVSLLSRAVEMRRDG